MFLSLALHRPNPHLERVGDALAALPNEGSGLACVLFGLFGRCEVAHGGQVR